MSGCACSCQDGFSTFLSANHPESSLCWVLSVQIPGSRTVQALSGSLMLNSAACSLLSLELITFSHLSLTLSCLLVFLFTCTDAGPGWPSTLDLLILLVLKCHSKKQQIVENRIYVYLSLNGDIALVQQQQYNNEYQTNWLGNKNRTELEGSDEPNIDGSADQKECLTLKTENLDTKLEMLKSTFQ